MDQFTVSRLSRFIGYGLLILSLFDLIHNLVPVRLMDPLWQFETIGQLVEGVPLPLIGLFMIFYGAQDRMEPWELPLPKLLFWGALFAGIGYLLLVPLGVISSLYLDRASDNQVKQQIVQGMDQVKLVEKQLEQVNTEAQMQAFLSSVPQLPPEIKPSQNLGEYKQRIADFITKTTEASKKQLEQTFFERRLQLLKQSVTWILSSLVSGVLFIRIWQMTERIRSMKVED